MGDDAGKNDQPQPGTPVAPPEEPAPPENVAPPTEKATPAAEKLTQPRQKPAAQSQKPFAGAAPTPDEDELVLKEPATPGKPPENPATLCQKIWLAGYLLVLVLLLLPSVWSVIDRLNASALAEVSIVWEMPAGVTLNPGPAAFRYDATQKKLVHYGAISTERKLELRALFAAATETPSGVKPAEAPAGAKPPATPSGTKPATKPAKPAEAAAPDSGASAVTRMETLRRSYNEAIDNLAYLANVRQGGVISLLLVLGCLGGTLGAILRSLVDFVGNACYTQQLDLKRWWPLYFTRPLVGAILGFVLVVLFKAQLLTAGDAQPGTDSFWWLGVAILGGFSTVDVTLRLRLAAKALFGVDDKKG